MMEFWAGLILGCMVGTLVGVAYLSMVVVAKESDEQMETTKNKGFEGKA